MRNCNLADHTDAEGETKKVHYNYCLYHSVLSSKGNAGRAKKPASHLDKARSRAYREAWMARIA